MPAVATALGTPFGSPFLFTGALDQFTSNLDGAWSVTRRLLTSYTGALLRVRRSSDNAEQDIGYLANGNLDSSSLLSFVGAGDGYVHILYGQYGSVNLATSSASEQMQIVSSGTLIKDAANYPAMSNPSTQWIQSDAAVSWRHWFMSHDTGTYTFDNSYLFDARPDLANSYLFDASSFGPNWTSLRKNGVATTLDNAGLFDAAPHLSTILGSDSTASVAFFLRFYGFSAANRTGKLREVVTYNAALSNAQRNAVEAALILP